MVSQGGQSAVLLLNGWSGRSEHPIELVGETPKRYRVRLLCDVRLPSRRQGRAGDVILVPKHAIKLSSIGNPPPPLATP
jgi:hypothetical protein